MILADFFATPIRLSKMKRIRIRNTALKRMRLSQSIYIHHLGFIVKDHINVLYCFLFVCLVKYYFRHNIIFVIIVDFYVICP